MSFVILPMAMVCPWSTSVLVKLDLRSEKGEGCFPAILLRPHHGDDLCGPKCQGQEMGKGTGQPTGGAGDRVERTWSRRVNRPIWG